MKAIISKLEKADPNNKRDLVKAYYDIEYYAKHYDLKEVRKK